MANPLFSNPRPQMTPPPQNMLQQFAQFARFFKGNPQQMGQELLRNGQLTQAQFEQYSQIADQLTGRKRS